MFSMIALLGQRVMTALRRWHWGNPVTRGVCINVVYACHAALADMLDLPPKYNSYLMRTLLEEVTSHTK